MRILTVSLLAVVVSVVLTMGPAMTVSHVYAADAPTVPKESKPVQTTSGTEQKGSNVDRNANTKTTAPPKN